MLNDEPMNTAKDSIALVGEVIKAAGDSPQVKEAAGNLGQTAVTLTKTINNVLVPLAAINFAFDKARAYFSDRFPQDIAEKAQEIPQEYIVEPKASIAGPTLQGLAFAHEELNLKEMYLNLLATAMDSRAAADAHPAFVEIIKQLDGEDARLIREALQSSSSTPIVQIHLTIKSGGYIVLVQHLLNYKDTETDKPIEDRRLPAMIDNWVRLGLVQVSYDRYLHNQEAYDWVEQRPEFEKLSQEPRAKGETITYQKGLLKRTEFGKRFAKAIGLL